MKRIMAVVAVCACLVAAVGAQSGTMTVTLDATTVAALQASYNALVPPRGPNGQPREKPTFEAWVLSQVTRGLRQYTAAYEQRQQANAKRDLETLDTKTCKKLDASMREKIAKALPDLKTLCGEAKTSAVTR